jgi:hypothetical protein
MATGSMRAPRKDGDAVDNAGGVLLDVDAPHAVAGDGRATAAAEPAGECLPQRRVAEGLELTAGPGAGLDRSAVGPSDQPDVDLGRLLSFQPR